MILVDLKQWYSVSCRDGGIRLGWRCLLGLVFDRRRLTDLAADRLLRAVVDELDRLAGSSDQPQDVAG